MPRLAPAPLQLNKMEREQLQKLVNRHSTPQQLAIRASIILLADEGQNHREIARKLNISRDMAFAMAQSLAGVECEKHCRNGAIS